MTTPVNYNVDSRMRPVDQVVQQFRAVYQRALDATDQANAEQARMARTHQEERRGLREVNDRLKGEVVEATTALREVLARVEELDRVIAQQAERLAEHQRLQVETERELNETRERLAAAEEALVLLRPGTTTPRTRLQGPRWGSAASGADELLRACGEDNVVLQETCRQWCGAWLIAARALRRIALHGGLSPADMRRIAREALPDGLQGLGSLTGMIQRFERQWGMDFRNAAQQAVADLMGPSDQEVGRITRAERG